MSDLNRGKSMMVKKYIRIWFFVHKLRKIKIRFGHVAYVCWSPACGELGTGCRMKTCMFGRPGGVCDGDGLG